MVFVWNIHVSQNVIQLLRFQQHIRLSVALLLESKFSKFSFFCSIIIIVAIIIAITKANNTYLYISGGLLSCYIIAAVSLFEYMVSQSINRKCLTCMHINVDVSFML